MVFFGIVSREFFQELPVNQNLNAVQSAMYKYTMYSGVFGAQSINIHVFTIFNPPPPPPPPQKNIYIYIICGRMGLGTQILGLSHSSISFTPGVFAK